MTRADFELECIREFAHSGLLFSNLSAPEQRERIRVAILKAGLQGAPFRDSGMSYGAAYQAVYLEPIELRRGPRDAHGRPLPEVLKDLGAEEDAENV